MYIIECIRRNGRSKYCARNPIRQLLRKLLRGDRGGGNSAKFDLLFWPGPSGIRRPLVVRPRLVVRPHSVHDSLVFGESAVAPTNLPRSYRVCRTYRPTCHANRTTRWRSRSEIFWADYENNGPRSLRARNATSILKTAATFASATPRNAIDMFTSARPQLCAPLPPVNGGSNYLK